MIRQVPSLSLHAGVYKVVERKQVRVNMCLAERWWSHCSEERAYRGLKVNQMTSNCLNEPLKCYQRCRPLCSGEWSVDSSQTERERKKSFTVKRSKEKTGGRVYMFLLMLKCNV